MPLRRFACPKFIYVAAIQCSTVRTYENRDIQCVIEMRNRVELARLAHGCDIKCSYGIFIALMLAS